MKNLAKLILFLFLLQAIVIWACIYVGFLNEVDGSDPNNPPPMELRESQYAPPEGDRSGRWPTVRKHFLRDHPTCAACGRDFNLNVHHIVPFHTNPQLELSTGNLITLCAGDDDENSDGDRWSDYNCHFYIGHDPDGPNGPAKANWKLSNPNVRNDARKQLNRK